ncbi:MAG: DNA-directed RNA polymerase subunit omega [Rickettsiales bacterium]|nr:DNA-directed RNA polymerase subunit omega [Rickettsiales bacterium]
MARTTNTDTLPFVSSRYELGMLGTQRVRDLNGGAEPVAQLGSDKPTVTALREIASGNLDVENLRHELVQSYKTTLAADETEGAIESKSEDPLLREIDAELENAIVAADEMPAEELEDVLEESTPGADEE